MREQQTKAAVSVGEMAEMVGLSRSRFYQLMQAGVFPEPQRDPETGRPFYAEEQQRVCLEVREGHRGVNGRPHVFSRKRTARRGAGERGGAKGGVRSGTAERDIVRSLRERVQALGLVGVSAVRIEEALTELYPSGVPQDDDGQVVRRLFLHLQRQQQGEEAGGQGGGGG